MNLKKLGFDPKIGPFRAIRLKSGNGKHQTWELYRISPFKRIGLYDDYDMVSRERNALNAAWRVGFEHGRQQS